MKSTSVIDFLLIKNFSLFIFYLSKHATIKNCYKNNSKEKNLIIFAIKKGSRESCLQYLHSIFKSKKKIFIVEIQNCMQFQLYVLKGKELMSEL